MRGFFINALFLHQIPDIKQLFEVVANERQILPALVEKDYWIMHCLWGIQQQGFRFELKGGTSLSKGFNIVDRFSEDIDIQIHPRTTDDVKIGKNHDKPVHIEHRRLFFDRIAAELAIPDLVFQRDTSFDDKLKMRGAGIRAEYSSLFLSIAGLKEGIVLELGFDQTTPNVPRTISSWAFEKALTFNLPILDNRAIDVLCYCPEYTFVEKLQTISTKYRLQQKNNTMPTNFLRHYYDIYKLLENKRVLDFIGSAEYVAHKQHRFRTDDETDLSKNPAFILADKNVRELYSKEFNTKTALYFNKPPNLEEILQKIQSYIDVLSLC